MAMIDRMPIHELLLHGLESRVKDQLRHEIIEKHVAEFRREFEELVDSKLGGLILESIEQFRDMAEQSDHYSIKAYLNGEPIKKSE